MPEFTENEIELIRSEITRRKTILIKAMQEGKIKDELHNDLIKKYIQNNESPQRPKDIKQLMMQFMISATSQADIRKQLSNAYNKGQNYGIKDISRIMSELFNDSRFLKEINWHPEVLKAISQDNAALVAKQVNLENYRPHTYGNPIKPHVVLILKTGSEQIYNKTINGLNSFYEEIQSACDGGPLTMWRYAQSFSAPIRNVGIALTCDFFKEIGFTKFLKVDYQIREKFPQLIQHQEIKYTDKKLFLIFQELVNLINMTPFHLDKLIYVYGWAEGKGYI